MVNLPGIRELWQETLGDPDICVAILDGPVDLAHTSLQGANLRQLETLVPGDVDRGPACRHGTHVASVIFGRHDGPVPGIAPSCRGVIVPVFESVGAYTFRACSQVDLARALGQAVQHGARVINVSGGQFSPSGTAHPILADAVCDCARRGVLIVAATGNEGCACLHVPAALDSVLAVGAMTAEGEPLEFSNWGGGRIRSRGFWRRGKASWAPNRAAAQRG
jgi:subtilisin family serine protease